MILWLVGLTLCVTGLVSLYFGFAAERGTHAAVGIGVFIVLWQAGFLCFAGAS